MRKISLGVVAVAALIAVMAAGIGANRPAPAPEMAAIAPEPAAAVAAPPPQLADAETPSAPSDLPTIVVAPREFHVVPENGPPEPVPPVTLMTRDGQPVSSTPTARPSVALATAPAVAPARQQPPLANPPGGAAQALGGTELSIGGHAVRLFGVRPAEARDRCAGADGTSEACGDAARAALAARLAGKGAVTCRMPEGQHGDPAFICRDAAGIDLGRLLVAGGLALADTKSSYDYVDAERTAHSGRFGLWRYR